MRAPSCLLCSKVKVQVSDCDGKSHKIGIAGSMETQESINNYAIGIISLLYSTGRKLPRAATLFYRVHRSLLIPNVTVTRILPQCPHSGLCLSLVPTAIVGWSLL